MGKNQGLSLKDRFYLNKFIINEQTGCWEWQKSFSGGYGKIWENGQQSFAHRVSYRIHKGEIIDGLNVLHECDNSICVNPDHLFLGTQKENVIDCQNKGRRHTAGHGTFQMYNRNGCRCDECKQYGRDRYLKYGNYRKCSQV